MGKTCWLIWILSAGISCSLAANQPAQNAIGANIPIHQQSPGLPNPFLAASTQLLQAGLISVVPAEASHDGDQHSQSHENNIPHQMMILVLQVAVVVLAARLCGEIFERYLRQPSVLGELIAGMIIGPHALGPHISLFGSGPLFPLLEGALSVSPSLYGIATIASIILLFMVGLETDFYQFMRFAGPGAAVGVGGVAGAFITGDLLYVWYSGESFMSPAALFMGTVSTATSVGITARVLSEKKQLDSAEGTTILAGAVIDDVLGILILAVVGGVAAASSAAGQDVNWGHIGIIALKAFGFWLVATAVGIAVSKRLAKGLRWFKTEGSAVALGFGLACLVAGIAETFGLAMIIGAYIMGLSLSKENISHFLEEALSPIYACLVPIFFAVMGMLVNFEAMMSAFWFGVIYSAVGIFSKVIGSGLPCYLVGFNTRGAARIGIGMLPRGEVALIVAGVGASQGFIGADMFGAVIMMTLVTTIIAPPMLVSLFKDSRSGLRHKVDTKDKTQPKLIVLNYFTWANHQFMISCLQQTFQDRGFNFHLVDPQTNVYKITGKIEDQETTIVLRDYQDRLEIKTGPDQHRQVFNLVREAYDQAKARLNGLEVEEKDESAEKDWVMPDYDPA